MKEMELVCLLLLHLLMTYGACKAFPTALQEKDFPRRAAELKSLVLQRWRVVSLGKEALEGQPLPSLYFLLGVGAVQPGEGSGVTLEQLPVPGGATGRMERGSSQGGVVIGQEGMAVN